MVSRISAPKYAHILVARTREYVTLHDKSDFSDMLKLNILTEGFFPGYAAKPTVTTSFLTKERQEGQAQREEKQR